jgi:hypothetical protein
MAALKVEGGQLAKDFLIGAFNDSIFSLTKSDDLAECAESPSVVG